MVGTSVSWLVDLHIYQGPHEAGGSNPPSFRAPSPKCGGLIGSPSSGPCPKESPLHATTTTMSVAPKEEEVTSLQEMPLPIGPSEAIAGPLEEHSASGQHCWGDLTSPATMSLNSHYLPDPSFEST